MALAASALVLGAAIGGGGMAFLNLKGENHSEQLNKIITENLIDASIKFIAKTSNEQRIQVQGDNDFTLNVSGTSFKGCTNNIVQGNEIRVRGDLSFDSNLQATFRRDIANAIETALKNSNEQVNEKLNLGQSNTSIVNNEITQTNIIDLSQIYLKEFENLLNVIVLGSNNIDITFEDSYIDCSGLNKIPFLSVEQLNQFDIDIRQTVREGLVLESITKLTNNIVYNIENINNQRNTGVDPLAFLGMFGAIGIVLSIIVAVLKVLIKKMGGSSKYKLQAPPVINIIV